MNDLAHHLAQHRFRDLFIEVLGWDRASGGVEVSADDQSFVLSVVAQKRGLQVLHVSTDHLTLINRGRLRRLQRQLAKLVHEHIVIYSCESPRKQVWQWAIRRNEGHSLRHREHPFFSMSPPGRLLKRLHGLQFTLDEEDDVTLVDALQRVRGALDTEAELNLFVNRPKYAELSDQLAKAMETGGTTELHTFVVFHLALVGWAVKRVAYLFPGDNEDALQTGMVGLVHAARRYQRSFGNQFSTFATWCIRGFCKRDGPLWYLPVRFPDYAFWDCLKLRGSINLAFASGGPEAVRYFLEDLATTDRRLAGQWIHFERVSEMRSLSSRAEPEYWEARRLPEFKDGPIASTLRNERVSIVREAVGKLAPRDAAFVRLKYGLDGPEQTLEEIGQQYGITRERVRQRLVKVHERLQRLLVHFATRPTGENADSQNNSEDSEQDYQMTECRVVSASNSKSRIQ